MSMSIAISGWLAQLTQSGDDVSTESAELYVNGQLLPPLLALHFREKRHYSGLLVPNCGCQKHHIFLVLFKAGACGILTCTPRTVAASAMPLHRT